MMSTQSVNQPILAPAIAEALSLAFERAIDGADFVWIDGHVFRADYLRAPDESTTKDDVMVEGHNENAQLMLTQRDLEKAETTDDGGFKLASGATLRFLAQPTVH